MPSSPGFDFEGALIGRVVRDGDISAALDARVAPDWFIDPDHRAVWELIAKHFRQYGEVPTERILAYDRPDYALVDSPESMAVYVDRMSDRRRRNILRETVTDMVSELEDDEGDSLRAADILSQGLTRVYTEASLLRDVNLIETWEERVANYEFYAENQGKLLGIPMGVHSIDQATSGFQSENLITFVGRQKAGKSYMMMHAAITAHRMGYTPLFIGFEMSNDEQASRYDSLVARVNPAALIRGEATAKTREHVAKTLKRQRHMHPFILSADPSGGNTVSAIGAKIEQYQPDIVFVDGVYLMKDEEDGKDERQQLTNITRGFKRLAQRIKRPIVISTQALEWKIGRKGLTTSAIGYTSSFGQDSDILIGFESVDEDDDPELKRVKILDGRRVPRMETLVRVDFEHGTIEELEDDEAAIYDDLEAEMED